MKRATSLVGGIALMAASASPALAEWRWVDEGPTTHTETRVYEERIGPGPVYDYRSQPRTETYYEERYSPVVVTDRETWREGSCEVTRTYLSDGSSSDDRICTQRRLLLPHELFIDRMGRHFDRLRGY
jgi:hypothetical protein